LHLVRLHEEPCLLDLPSHSHADELWAIYKNSTHSQRFRQIWLNHFMDDRHFSNITNFILFS
jgi:hypothetical protein